LGAGGCEFEGLTFSNFQLLSIPFGATELPSINITVNPLMAGPTGPTGLEFALTVAVGAGDFLASRFQYDVLSSIGGLSYASVGLGGASATGDGVVTAVTDAGGAPVIALVDSFNSIPFSATTFGPAAFLTVITELGVDGGPMGTASFASATNQFATPEPSTWITAASAMALAFATYRRRKA